MDKERDQKFKADLKNGVAGLYQGFGRRPFGDNADVKKTAQALVALIDNELLPTLDAPMKAGGAYDASYTKKAARELLKRLAKSAAGPAAFPARRPSSPTSPSNWATRPTARTTSA